MRRTHLFLSTLTLFVTLTAVLLVVGMFSSVDTTLLRDTVARHNLTDPALFGEARYTRHLSQADRHAPFQDAPGAPEHFPSGSIAPPVRK